MPEAALTLKRDAGETGALAKALLANLLNIRWNLYLFEILASPKRLLFNVCQLASSPKGDFRESRHVETLFADFFND